MTADAEVEREIIERGIVVPVECGGWRLDLFLKRRIGRMSRTRTISITDPCTSTARASQAFVLQTDPTAASNSSRPIGIIANLPRRLRKIVGCSMIQRPCRRARSPRG